jgi:hypothetical protein
MTHPARHLPSALLTLTLALVAPACGDSDAEIVAGSDAIGGGGDGGDVGVVDDASADATVTPDASADADVAGPDVGPDADATADADAAIDPDADAADGCPGAAYCPCEANDDCDLPYCIEGKEGAKICAADCVTDCTVEGYTCALVQPPGSADSVSLCVPMADKLCNPCQASASCTGLGDPKAVCVAGGDIGSFCGTSCESDNGCPVGYSCADVTSVEGQDVKQCVPKDGQICSCSDAAIAQELSTVCYTGSGDGKCEGLRTCLAAGKPGAPAGGGLSACLAPDPKDEACNGVDDDCDGDTDEATCDDGNPCTEGACEGQAGCKTTNKAGPCDADGSVCTKDDACQDGACAAGAKVTCDDGNPCTDDSCDPDKGCVYTPAVGKACDADNTACTQNDQCDAAGQCVAGPPKACSTEDPCIKPKCNLVDGACLYPFAEGVDCNDGSACTTADKCIDPATGCKGSKLDCDDGEVCTADSCDPKTGCMHAAIPGPCKDGDECTAPDTCADGKCAGKADGVDCDDNNPCTKDSCDKVQGCLNLPQSATPCDDGNGCTVGDACDAGVCKPGSNTCACNTDAQCAGFEDGNLCNGTLFCDKSALPFKCKVNPVTVKTCDTSKDTFCASTLCVPATGACEVQKKVDGTSCDADASVCSSDDQCKDGVCTPGAALPCDDKNPCTTDSCDPKTGCTFVANTLPCDADGDACTVDDLCADKSCQAGAPKDCDDGEFCTEDGCNPADGACTTKNLSKGCEDGSACTEGDACADVGGKWTCKPGPGPDCDDKNPCTKDTCDKTAGCKSVNDDTAKVACYEDGDPKTIDVGICKQGEQACKDGKLGACLGAQLPLKEETCGNGKDDTCNGQTDEGCKPTAYEARFGAAVVTGKTKVGNAELDARVFVGGSVAAGVSKGDKTTADFGFYAWLRSLLGK